MAGGGESGHVDTDLRDDGLCGPVTHARNRLQQLDRLTERGDYLVDGGVESIDLTVEVVDVIEM